MLLPFSLIIEYNCYDATLNELKYKFYSIQIQHRFNVSVPVLLNISHFEFSVYYFTQIETLMSHEKQQFFL